MIDGFQRIIIGVKGVDVTVEKSGDTWVINDAISKGKMLYNAPGVAFIHPSL